MAEAGNIITFTLKESTATTVVLTGTIADESTDGSVNVTLTSGTETKTITAAVDGAESPKDFTIGGLTPATTYAVTYSGDISPSGNVTSVTTLADGPKTATESQWADLANRVKNNTERIYTTSGTTNSILLPSDYRRYHLELYAHSPAQSQDGGFSLQNTTGGEAYSNFPRRLEASTGNVVSCFEFEQTGTPRVWVTLASAEKIGSDARSISYIADISKLRSNQRKFMVTGAAYVESAYDSTWAQGIVNMNSDNPAITLGIIRHNGTIDEISWHLTAYK